MDRDLYLPRCWAEDRARREEAGVPDTVEYRSKTELAVEIVERALDAGVRVKWVVADALYGSDRGVPLGPRCFLEKRQQGYVVALRSVAYYYVFGRADTTLDEMVAEAGKRWMIEETLEATKGEVGLDEYEVRRWQSWYRHITLALLAHAFLAVTRSKTLAKGVA